jgi:hypothetical protein
MRIARWLAGALLPVVLVSGCQSMNNTEKGAVAGGGIGAGAGALIGHATGHTGAGALIGGLTAACWAARSATTWTRRRPGKNASPPPKHGT